MMSTDEIEQARRGANEAFEIPGSNIELAGLQPWNISLEGQNGRPPLPPNEHAKSFIHNNTGTTSSIAMMHHSLPVLYHLQSAEPIKYAPPAADMPPPPSPARPRTGWFAHPFICLLIFFILGLGLAIPIMIFSITKTGPSSDLGGALATLTTNLNSPPLVNVMIRNTTENCPTGFQPINLGFWQGTEAGCYCSGTFIVPGTCPQTLGSCSTILPQPQVAFTNWKNKKLCGLYSSKYVMDVQCPAGYKSCYVGGCFPLAEACPMTNISFTYDKNGVPIAATAKSDGLSPPISGLKISVNGPPCFDANQSPAGAYYPLLNPPLPTGCSDADPAVLFSLDQDSSYNVLISNALGSSVSFLPGYVDSTGDLKAYLAVMTKYSMRSSSFCASVSPYCFQEMYDKVPNFLTGNLIIACCALGTLVLAGLSFLGLHQAASRKKSFKPAFKVCLGVFLTLTLLAGAGLLAHNAWYQDNLNSCGSYVDDVFDQNCFVSPVITNNLSDFQGMWTGVSYALLILTCIYAFICVLFVPWALLWLYFENRPRQPKSASRQSPGQKYIK
jgi:hypothetical protein